MMSRLRPLCSVVIPMYNMERTVEETLDSCMYQSVPDLEIIVIDDGSTDGSARLVAEHASEPRMITLPHCGVPSVVRNAGILAARGHFVQFLDADDLLGEGKIRKQLYALLEAERSDTVGYCDYAFFFERDSGVRVLERRGPPDGDYWPGDLIGQFSLYTVVHRFLFPRQLLIDVGLFDPGLTHAEDLDLWLRLAIRGTPFVHLDATLAFYREHVSHSLRSPLQERRCRLVVARKLYGYLAQQGLHHEYASQVAAIERAEAEALELAERSLLSRGASHP